MFTKTYKLVGRSPLPSLCGLDKAFQSSKWGWLRIACCSNGWREEGRGLGEERTDGEECRTDDKQHLLGNWDWWNWRGWNWRELCRLQICEHLYNVVIKKWQYLLWCGKFSNQELPMISQRCYNVYHGLLSFEGWSMPTSNMWFTVWITKNNSKLSIRVWITDLREIWITGSERLVSSPAWGSWNMVHMTGSSLGNLIVFNLLKFAA